MTQKEERLFGKPIITQEEMRARIKALGLQIGEDYQGKNLLLVGVLKGAFAFFSDLARAIPLPLRVDFLVVSSSGKGPQRREEVQIIADIPQDLKGQDILVVEDIVDSGLTLTFLKERILGRGPKSLKFATLLDKPQRRKMPVVVDYVGFTISNKYVVGYGLDYDDKYRNLPYIAVLDKVSDDESPD